MKYFIEKSDTIEIHCWNDENEVIKETKALVKEHPELPEEGGFKVEMQPMSK